MRHALKGGSPFRRYFIEYAETETWVFGIICYFFVTSPTCRYAYAWNFWGLNNSWWFFCFFNFTSWNPEFNPLPGELNNFHKNKKNMPYICILLGNGKTNIVYFYRTTWLFRIFFNSALVVKHQNGPKGLGADWNLWIPGDTAQSVAGCNETSLDHENGYTLQGTRKHIPPNGKAGKSSSKCHFWWDMLVAWRVHPWKWMAEWNLKIIQLKRKIIWINNF